MRGIGGVSRVKIPEGSEFFGCWASLELREHNMTLLFAVVSGGITIQDVGRCLDGW